MVKADTLYAAGQLPKFVDNLYHDIEEDLWMVPTAEVPLTGMYMGEVLEENTLPQRFTAYTPCFRREKMSAGRDVRGIKRGHQFDKVEMYVFCKPEESAAELEKMLAAAEATCAGLELPYRIKRLCTGDIGFNSMITYDLEVWAAGCGEWLEVSSVSNVGDFQARRANIKYKPADGGKTRLVHTLNGSGLGMPRTMIAVLENYQQADGSIKVPKVLLPWMGGVESDQIMENIANSAWFISILAAVMVVGLLGLLFYIIPGLTIIWLAILAYGIMNGFTVWSGILFGVITLLMIGGNLVDNYFMGDQARKTGASWVGIVVALVLGVVGTFVLPPFGGILFAAVGILVVEWINKKNFKEGLKSTGGMLKGCGFAVVVRFSIGVVMIGLWVAWFLWLNKKQLRRAPELFFIYVYLVRKIGFDHDEILVPNILDHSQEGIH